MTDNRDDFEFLDGDVLGEDIGDDDQPGVNYPDDRPWGVQDPSLDAPDDLATRELRRDVTVPTDEEETITLVDDSAIGLPDTEPQEIGTAVDVSADELTPEESALHIVEIPEEA